MLDEAAEFMSIPTDVDEMFEQARKHRLSMIMATQQLSQLQPASLERTVMNNARSKIVLTTYSSDATQLRREMGGDLELEHFTQMPMYEAIVQPMTTNGVAPPVTVKTLKPTQITRVAEQIRQRSRMELGRPVAEVEQEMADRRRIDGPVAARAKRTSWKPPRLGWE
jgi:DNA helicase HerA-like ATPase